MVWPRQAAAAVLPSSVGRGTGLHSSEAVGGSLEDRAREESAAASCLSTGFLCDGRHRQAAGAWPTERQKGQRPAQKSEPSEPSGRPAWVSVPVAAAWTAAAGPGQSFLCQATEAVGLGLFAHWWPGEETKGKPDATCASASRDRPCLSLHPGAVG